MIARPPIAPVPGPYWPAAGTIPKSEPIPPRTDAGMAIAGLVASVWPSNHSSDTIVFEDAVNPGVDPVSIDTYSPWVKAQGWIYIPSVNKVYRIGVPERMSATAFRAQAIEGNPPAVQNNPLFQRQPILIPGNPMDYSVVVETGSVLINDTPVTKEFKSPARHLGSPRPVAYDTASGTAIIYLNQPI